MIATSVAEAAEDYLAGRYPQRCIAEWARQTLQIPVQDEQIRVESPEELDGLQADLRGMAKEEATNNISMTLGEYMDPDVDRREWDLRGLSSWAMSRFGVNLPQNQLRKMEPHEVEQALAEAAYERLDKADLSGAAGFLQPDFAEASLADWALAKFNVRVQPEDLKGELEDVTRRLQDMVEQAYRRREIEYPVEYALDMTIGQADGDNVYALGSLADWANRKFDAGFSVERLRGMSPSEIRSELIELSEAWSDGERLEGLIRGALGSHPSVDAAVEFARNRFDTELQAEDFDGDVAGKLLEAGRSFLRREMTELERFVLLQIYDSSWKDHLLAMDHLKSGIGLRGYAEQDPRVAYKRDGARLFQEMLGGVRDKITDMVFKVRLTAGAEMANVYEISSMVHEQLQGYDHLARDMADQQAAAEPRKVETIVRDKPKVGRNAPCPCGSGKKYKKCCGKNV
jgi:preprotein translocase subunit SecA